MIIRRATHRQQGFSLVEMAVVMVILGLLLGGGLMFFTAQMTSQRSKEARATLALAQEALYAYAQINGRLPCPATATSSGQESPIGGGTCTQQDGWLPAATLGIANHTDGYLHDPRASGSLARIRYAVTDKPAPPDPNAYAATRPGGIKVIGMGYFAPSGFMRICKVADCTSGADVVADAIAVLVAPGQNAAVYPLGAGPDEQDNYDADATFVHHEQGTATSPGGEFDDLVVWITPALLASRMVAAGQLP